MFFRINLKSYLYLILYSVDMVKVKFVYNLSKYFCNIYNLFMLSKLIFEINYHFLFFPVHIILLFTPKFFISRKVKNKRGNYESGFVRSNIHLFTHLLQIFFKFILTILCIEKLKIQSNAIINEII